MVRLRCGPVAKKANRQRLVFERAVFVTVSGDLWRDFFDLVGYRIGRAVFFWHGWSVRADFRVVRLLIVRRGKFCQASKIVVFQVKGRKDK